MSSISFFTPVTYGGKWCSAGEMLVEKFDDYFFLGGRKASVIQGDKIGNSQRVQYINAKSSFLATTLKVISYATVILPLVALVGKAILRSFYHFHLFFQPIGNVFPPSFNGPFDGGSPPPDGGSPPPPPASLVVGSDRSLKKLDYNTVYTLSAEEILQYRLKAEIKLAYTSPSSDVVPVCNTAVSELPEYNDSYFYFERDPASGLYKLERRSGNDFSSPNFPLTSPLKLKEMVRISPEDFLKLNISPSTFYSDGEYVCGISSLSKYRGLEFRWKETNDQRILITAVYKESLSHTRESVDSRVRLAGH